MDGSQSPASLTPGPGGRLGPYRIENEFGRGPVGVVCRAVDGRDGRRVALKVMRPELADNALYAERFARETRVAREVEHPNLVPIVDAGEAGRHRFLVMAYVDGPTLEARIRDRALELDEAMRVIAELASGLDALHRLGLVHRDVKPSNILLADSRAMLTDFGLAKGPAYTVLTRPGQLVGTPHYLAPELIRGETAQPASDVYALGCLAYACLAGEPPFVDDNVFQVTVSHLEDEPPTLASRGCEIPADLASAVLTALRKEAAERPPSARAYALELWRAAGVT